MQIHSQIGNNCNYCDDRDIGMLDVPINVSLKLRPKKNERDSSGNSLNSFDKIDISFGKVVFFLKTDELLYDVQELLC